MSKLELTGSGRLTIRRNAAKDRKLWRSMKEGEEKYSTVSYFRMSKLEQIIIFYTSHFMIFQSSKPEVEIN